MHRSGRWHRSGRLGKVLIDFGDFELTLREAIFGVAIAGVLYMLGFFCAGLIEKNVHDEQLKYRQAAQIQVQSEFAHAMKTDVGLAFVQGHFRTLDPVQYDNLPGKHLMIHACYQKYQMHTRIVHYTTGTGKNLRHHTRTEHYWTWDTYKTDTKHAKQVEFCGSKFDQAAFAYGGIYGRGHTANIGYHHRIVSPLCLRHSMRRLLACLQEAASKASRCSERTRLSPRCMKSTRRRMR